MSTLMKSAVFFGFLLIIGGCGKHRARNKRDIQATTVEVGDDRLVNADATPEDWLSYGRNYYEDRYSSLDQITKDNIKKLGLAWSINLETIRGIEGTPLVVDGIMYLSGPWSVVFAIDARKREVVMDV